MKRYSNRREIRWDIIFGIVFVAVAIFINYPIIAEYGWNANWNASKAEQMRAFYDFYFG